MSLSSFVLQRSILLLLAAVPSFAAAQAQEAVAPPEPSAEAAPEASEPKQADADDVDALAEQLANPVAALISVPFQLNYDTPVGDDGERLTLNIQPVIPIRLTERWNLISRTILPLIDQRDVIPDRHQSGLGDVTQTLFLSPREVGPSGVVWGVGPVFVLPTGGDGLSAETWAAGGSFVVLRQRNGWTLGTLANHVVDVGGGSDRIDINSTFLQPFVSRAFDGGRSVTLNTEATYDWNGHQWTVPINLTYSKVTKFGNQMVSFIFGVRAYAHTPGKGPDWGLRFVVVLL